VPPWDERSVEGEGDAIMVGEPRAPRQAVARLDLTRRADRERLDQLLNTAAAAIVSGPMRFRRTFLLDEPELRPLRSELVYCGLTGFGTTGPLADQPATEFDVQLMSGMARQLGQRGAMPVRQGFHLVSVDTGLAAAQAVLAGLLRDDRDEGVGRHFEVSLLRTAVALNGWNITAESGHDGVEGKQVQAAGWPPDHGYTCQDRQVLISLRNNDEGWVKFLVALDRVDILADPDFNTLDQLRKNEWRLPDLLAETTARLTSAELNHVVARCGGELLCVLEPSEVWAHPQVLAQQLTKPGSAVVELPIDLVTR
jgi:crotonobetainyl-CoA:carnitine CoA-transferase CaiB-like acyl-CoA transferase